jgi:hypothetical protein
MPRAPHFFKFEETAMSKPTRVRSTPAKTSKSESSHFKTADDALFKLHDNFCMAYCEVLALRAGGQIAATATKDERKLEKKWERSVDVATDKARAVIEAPAYTLEGMLMKIHVAGFAFNHTKLGTFTAPYHGRICASGKPQQWEPHETWESSETDLIVSLRDDLERLAGKRS